MPDLSGTTRGPTGAPEGNVAIRVFRSGNHVLEAAGNSATDGSFTIPVSDDGPFYLVGQKGSMKGTTNNKRKPVVVTPPTGTTAWNDAEAWSDTEAWSN